MWRKRNEKNTLREKERWMNWKDVKTKTENVWGNSRVWQQKRREKRRRYRHQMEKKKKAKAWIQFSGMRRESRCTSWSGRYNLFEDLYLSCHNISKLINTKTWILWYSATEGRIKLSSSLLKIFYSDFLLRFFPAAAYLALKLAISIVWFSFSVFFNISN